jgi:hypothetical protein
MLRAALIMLGACSAALLCRRLCRRARLADGREKPWTSARAANSGAKRERKKRQRDAEVRMPIVACENCNDYRDLIPRCIEPDDVVLEVGCHVGGTTGLIGALAAQTLGIDSSNFWLDEAREAYPHIRFEQVRECLARKETARHSESLSVRSATASTWPRYNRTATISARSSSILADRETSRFSFP